MRTNYATHEIVLLNGERVVVAEYDERGGVADQAGAVTVNPGVGVGVRWRRRRGSTFIPWTAIAWVDTTDDVFADMGAVP